MKLLLIIVASLVSLALIVFLIGAMIPRRHLATSEITLRQPVDTVYKALRDLGGMPAWWSDLKTSERVAGVPGERWKQVAGGFTMQLDVTDDAPPRGFTTRIVEEKGAAFGGKWIYVLEPTNGGTTVRISEDGWIGPAPFRVMAKLGGLHRTIDGVLVALGRKFGEEVKPVHQ
jgi:uncharacterized protein YndB with AHSA1/START domain